MSVDGAIAPRRVANWNRFIGTVVNILRLSLQPHNCKRIPEFGFHNTAGAWPGFERDFRRGQNWLSRNVRIEVRQSLLGEIDGSGLGDFRSFAAIERGYHADQGSVAAMTAD